VILRGDGAQRAGPDLPHDCALRCLAEATTDDSEAVTIGPAVSTGLVQSLTVHPETMSSACSLPCPV
jgi:hypothetical protein